MNLPASPAIFASPHDILLGPDRPDLIRNEVLADLLEATAARVPEKTALIFGEYSLTYAELDAAAGRVASRLIEAGVRPGQLVGLWLPRGLPLLVMQAGIAKSGAGWLPFDADTPVERIGICLEDAGAVGIVSCAALADALAPLGRTVWCAEALDAPLDGPPCRREGVSPAHPAYVIYTSGSTGKPKGIEINQGSICHFLRSENAVLGVCGDDRVYQGFSVAFDMSFEEIWISYLVGATLWIAPKELATDPEALPRALAANHVSVLHAVPTLLALFAEDPPNLRLINLGGEMCPEALVERWAKPGRQIFNTYGPTEATVSASLAELKAGEPVTIGTPLPNYGLLVIDDQLRLLPRGETGELCITGPGVAAGYLGRADLTAEKFLPNPWAHVGWDTRMYRTGDLARIDTDGRVQCLGRADDQVKVRGFRVELGEIEAVLARQPGVGTCAVVLREDEGIDHELSASPAIDGGVSETSVTGAEGAPDSWRGSPKLQLGATHELVAFIVPEADALLSGSELRRHLAEVLPPYMVPGRFETLALLPRLTSGKIDRKALRAMPLAAPQAPAGESDVAQNPVEETLFAALARLFPGQPIRREADFFSDLGGHSLLAARLASALREDPRFASLTVRDIYQTRRIGAIAQVLVHAAAAKHVVPDADFAPPPALRRWLCGLAQLLAVPPLVALYMIQWLAPFFTYHFYTGEPGDSIPLAIGMSALVFWIATQLGFVVAIIGKRLIAPKLKPGRYPLWGVTYYRWWLADRLIEAAPNYLIAGSSLFVWYLRALGAKIGRDVQIGSITLRAPELLSLGDGVSIGTAVNFENARVERGQLVLGRIELAHNACVGSYAVVEGNTSIGEFGHLEGLSALTDGEHLPAHRVWSGSPARDVGAFDPTSLPPRPQPGKLRRGAENLCFTLGAMLVSILFFLPVFPAFMLIDSLDDLDGFQWAHSTADMVTDLMRVGKYFVLALPASALLVICTALLAALIRWSFMPRLRAGRFPVHGWTYVSKWLVNQIQETSLQFLHGVYATIYAPVWYRLLGAKVGRGAEISTALGVVPDMLTLGEESFIADAVLLGDEEIDGGWMTVRPTVVSRRSFIGNGAYVPDGTVVPENVLIGVQSRAPANAAMQSGDTWLGSPPLNLPAREALAGFPEHLTFRPSLPRRIGRGLVEALRIVAPHALVIAVGYTVIMALMPAAARGDWLTVCVGLAVAGLLYGVGAFLFVVALKWPLVGRYRQRSSPMWTPFVWLSEAVTNLYEGIAVPNFLRYLRGTPWLPVALRMLGAKIGHGVYLDTTDMTEYDCVSIGDHCEVNALAGPQTHLFEDRVMKIDRVNIGSKVTLGARNTVLYGASIGDGVRTGPLTLVMKGEKLPPASAWAGCPAAPMHAD
ncbi:MAG: amino acid adenylation domain-containing protein [Betaproteobacteria bacterium]|nr:amino acid adenylation domain-containing protein [Betaproteobacteria bacterium]